MTGIVLPGTGSVSPARHSLTTPCAVPRAAGGASHIGLAATSLRVAGWAAASSENRLAIVFHAPQSDLVCRGGEIAGLNERTEGCMTAVLRSCFSYQVAAGSTTSLKSVLL